MLPEKLLVVNDLNIYRLIDYLSDYCIKSASHLTILYLDKIDLLNSSRYREIKKKVTDYI